ncbi:MAG TPA: UDP-N-acetylmuramoyl-L-alanyl-D-glutamate--2,6-diaminopimelate ligase [Candidatus Obscuribacterales bacterium]
MHEPPSKPVDPVLRLLGVSGSGADVAITGVAYDSRLVRPGNAFVCIAGQQVDGNQFIEEAIRNGAACVFSEMPHKGLPVPVFQVGDTRLSLALLADHFYNHPSHRLRLLGVTGTNGKTTTTHLIEHTLNHAGKKTGLIGTLGARWPGQTGYENIKHTTPQSSDLHGILYRLAESGCSHVAMEVSSHAIVQKRIAGCHFAVACLTNISQDHLDFHQTMEHYWQSKRRLFAELVDSVQKSKFAVVNADDALAGEFLKAVGPGIAKLTYGWGAAADTRVVSADFDFGGMRVSLMTPGGPLEFRAKLAGRFNVYNLMAAVTICIMEGVDPGTVAEAIEQFTGVAGRFEIVGGDSGAEPLCIVDYAHTPDGLENVLTTARCLVPAGGKLIVVFGCGGDRDPSKRPQMGQIAETTADEVIVTSDNPRSEDPQQIIANILTGIKRTAKVRVEPDRARAIRQAVGGASDRDVVVVAGKGHENYQILADRTIPFDDRTEVRLALKQRAKARKEAGASPGATAKP